MNTLRVVNVAGTNIGCESCPRSYTLFVRWHPFKEGWEIRECVNCLARTAVNGRVFKQRGTRG